uniref:Putative secreted protein n=1 Tax=Amblyomma americanum TaxID=6943 RepID=A0A0C9S3G3_AMBAM
MNFKFISVALFWLAAYGAFMEFAEGSDHAVIFKDRKCKFTLDEIPQELPNKGKSWGSKCNLYICDFDKKMVKVLGCPPPEGDEHHVEFAGHWPECCKTETS